MPVNGVNVGRDVTVVLVDSSSTTMDFSIRTGFTKTPNTTEITSISADGIVRTLYLPAGWTGTLDYDRADSAIDDFFADMESDYYSGESLESATITETITEVDGSVSQYKYTGVIFKLNNAGDSTGEGKISMQVGWAAQRRKKIT